MKKEKRARNESCYVVRPMKVGKDENGRGGAVRDDDRIGIIDGDYEKDGNIIN